MENRETLKKIKNNVNVGFSTRDSGSLTATAILISLKDISLLFLNLHLLERRQAPRQF